GVWRDSPANGIQGLALWHTDRYCRPLVSEHSLVFLLWLEERCADVKRPGMDMRSMWHASRPRYQRSSQLETARNRNCATRGESDGNARCCDRDGPYRSRESHACQRRSKPARGFGAGKESCAPLRTFLIAGRTVL